MTKPKEEGRRVEVKLHEAMYQYVKQVKKRLGLISIGEAIRWIIAQHKQTSEGVEK